ADCRRFRYCDSQRESHGFAGRDPAQPSQSTLRLSGGKCLGARRGECADARNSRQCPNGGFHCRGGVSPMSLLLLPRSVPVDSAGHPLGLAQLFVYRAGTLTNLTVYTTSALSVAHSQPIVADTAGLFPAIYTNPASGFDLRLVLKTAAGVTVYDEDY